ncbi:neurobeachin-like protein 1 [Artemia franciscana]
MSHLSLESFMRFASLAEGSSDVDATCFWTFGHQDQSGFCIENPQMLKYSSLGLAFQLWLKVTPNDMIKHGRHLLYRLKTRTTSYLEAFLAKDGTIIIAVGNEKHYVTSLVVEKSLNDGQWHSIIIVHIAGRNLVSLDQIKVYIDGEEVHSATVRFPRGKQQGVSLWIGGMSDPANRTLDVFVGRNEGSSLFQGLGFSQNISAYWSLPATLRDFDPRNSSIRSVATGLEDYIWGPLMSFPGQLAAFAFFKEPLDSDQCRRLHISGPMFGGVYANPDASAADIKLKCCFAFSAYASNTDKLLELSKKVIIEISSGNRAQREENTDSVIFKSGGFLVLLKVLEDRLSKDVFPNLLSDNNKCIDTFDIAKFLDIVAKLLFRLKICRQEAKYLNFFEFLSVIAKQMKGDYLNDAYLDSIHRLGQVLKVDQDLHSSFVLNILCNFGIWKKATFDIQLRHLEYLTSTVKENRRFFRQRFGVQDFLDTIRLHLSSRKDPESVTLRIGLLRIVQYFLEKDSQFVEADSLLRYLYTCNSDHLICEALGMLCSALESKKCTDQLHLLLFEPKCAELLYAMVPNANDDVLNPIFSVISVLVKSSRVYPEDKERLFLKDYGFGGLLDFIKYSNLSEKTAELLADVLLSEEFSENKCQGFLSLCTSITTMQLELKLSVAKKMLDYLVSVPIAAKVFYGETDWAGCILRLLIKQGSGEIMPARCRTPFTPIPSAPTTPLLPPTPLPRKSTRSISGESFHENSIFGISERAGTPSISDDRSVDDSLDDIFSYGESDISAEEVKSMMLLENQNLRTPPDVLGSLSPCYMASKLTLNQRSVGAMENADEMKKVEEHVLLVTTSLGVIMSKGLEGLNSWKEAWKVLSSVDILTETNVFFEDAKRIKCQLIAIFGQSAVRWLRESQSPIKVLQVLKWLYSATELGTDQEGSLIILELAIQTMELVGFFKEDFLEMHAGITEIFHISLGLLVFYCASPILEVCSLSCARLLQFLNSRAINLDNQWLSYIMFEVGTVCTNIIQEGQEELYTFMLPLLKTLLKLSEASTFLPLFPQSIDSRWEKFYEQFKIFAKSNDWNRYLNDVVREPHDRFYAIYLSSLDLQLSKLSLDSNEEAAVAWHLHCRQTGESKLKFTSNILNPFEEERNKEIRRFQQSCLKNKHRQNKICKKWFLAKRKLTIPTDGENRRNKYWIQSEAETFCRNRPTMVVNENFTEHAYASKLRDESGYATAIRNDPLFQIPRNEKKDSYSEDLGEDYDIEEVNEINGDMVDYLGKIFKPVECQRVSLEGTVEGTLQVSDSAIVFKISNKYTLEIPIWMIREICPRRFCLQRTAIEIFLLENSNYFFNFKKGVNSQVYSQIKSLRPPNLISRFSFDTIHEKQLTQQWQRREISNFDYIMALNMVSGRTFNDLAQYPVFPWILKDYESHVLDLEDYSVYRDFARPIGAQTKKRREEIVKKYEAFEDPSGLVPKFHYGSHYSSPAVVAHYLVRIEPFTSIHIDLHGGKFDLADRQFFSLSGAWRSLVENPSDVKELIPELFTSPDVFRNYNKFDFGKVQCSSEVVNDVVLPKWASSPEDFIAKHREALESDYVSRNLHAWINLIFGNKVKGPQAEDAINVFYYSSYEDAVNLDLISDEKEKKSVEEMIRHFGQTPVQLFRFPHPVRQSIDEIKLSFNYSGVHRTPSIVCFPHARCNHTQKFTDASSQFVWTAFPYRFRPLLSAPSTNENLDFFCVSSKMNCTVYKMQRSAKTTLERITPTPKFGKEKNLQVYLHPKIKMSPDLFAVTPNGKHLLVGGSWDSTLHIFSVTKNKELQIEFCIPKHKEPITCISVDGIGLYCVTGSMDTTCIIWSISELTGLEPSRDSIPKCCHVLIGHKLGLKNVAISTELDSVVSSSMNSTVLVHSVKSGVYKWTLQPFIDIPLSINKIQIGEEGQVVFLFENKCSCFVIVSTTLHGNIINSLELERQPTALVVGRQHFLVADTVGNLEVRHIWKMSKVLSFAFPEPINCVSASPCWTHFVVSLRDGTFAIIEPDLRSKPVPTVIDI